jgi:hypothetical protein
MATKLEIWKQALVHLEKAAITTLTDDVEATYVFANAWGGAVEEAFNSGDWNFAKASIALSPNAAATPALGWAHAFDYPQGWLRTLVVSDTSDFATFHDYADEGGRLHAQTPALYLRFISDVNAADDKVVTWPTMFWRYVALKLAFDTCGKLTSGDTLEEKLRQRMERALVQAKNIDARNENNKLIQPGSWLRARRSSGVGGRHDGGATLVGGQISFGEGDV